MSHDRAALMAFVGAGTASATTTICTTTETPCENSNMHGPGTKVKAVSIGTTDTTNPAGNKHAVLTGAGGFGTVECNGTLEGTIETTTNPAGNGTANWSNCTSGNTAKTVTNGTVSIQWDSEHNGTVKVKGFVVEVNTFIKCFFGGEVSGTLTGGNPAIIHVTQEVEKIDDGVKHDSSAFCPSSGNIWHATYEVVEPKPLYVTNMP